MPVLPGRNDLPTLEGRGEVSVALYRQHRAAPLLFILSGIGSNPYFGLGTYFANVFHREGFHVVVLPSPMHWNFALAASPSGAPGYAPDDARDLYDVMAERLIGEMTDHWKPEQYHDEYREELLAFIKKRGREGKLASAPETEEEKPARAKRGEVIDLAELLQKSLAKSGTGKREERRRPRSKKTA